MRLLLLILFSVISTTVYAAEIVAEKYADQEIQRHELKQVFLGQHPFKKMIVVGYDNSLLERVIVEKIGVNAGLVKNVLSEASSGRTSKVRRVASLEDAIAGLTGDIDKLSYVDEMDVYYVKEEELIIVHVY